MKLQQPMPPSGGALSKWCASLTERLKHALESLDDGNIISLSASKLTGGIDPSSVPISGAGVSIGVGGITVSCGGDVIFRASPDGEIYLGNTDGTEYVKLENGHISICADTIDCAVLTAGTINSEGDI